MNNSSCEISNAVKSFLSSGGRIEVLPSFEFKPLPPRKEPALKTKKLAKCNKRKIKVKRSAALELENEIIKSGHIQRIVAMAGLGLSVIQISNRTNVPRSIVASLGFRLGFEISKKACHDRRVKKEADAL